jgi:hypothetical protein
LESAGGETYLNFSGFCLFKIPETGDFPTLLFEQSMILVCSSLELYEDPAPGTGSLPIDF